MKKIILFLSFALLVASCQRENLDEFIDVSQNDQPNIIVESSVVGLIVDEDGNGVSNAAVSLGSLTTRTNEIGVFTFQDELISKNASYLQVEKEGFFLGSRKFSTELDGTANVRIQLIPKKLSEIIYTQFGGNVELKGGEIDLPTGTYKKGNGESYNGEVQVYAKWLDPTEPETYDQMPGELTGIDSEGNINALATYGMIGVELIGEQGEYLNLPEGKTATIKISVPPDIISSAPSVIPLWHFNEISGNWEEEGEATLIGDEYVGEVSHFSFWNCDVPYPLVELSGNVTLNGESYEGAHIKITDLSNGFCAYNYTGERGYFSGKVPEGNDLKLTVFGPCGSALQEIDLGSFAMNTQIDDINLDANIEAVTISGTFDNCINDEIEIAFAVVQSEEFRFMIPIESDGSFSQVFPGCLGNAEVEIYGIDITYAMISMIYNEIFEGDIDVDIQACEDYFMPGIHIEYEGKNWELQDTFLNEYLTSIQVVDFNEDEYWIQIFGIDWDASVPQGLSPVVVCDFYYNTNDDVAEYHITFPTQGFGIEGFCDVSIINQGGLEVLRFEYVHTDEEDLIVFEPEIFPDEVEEVMFDISIAF